MREILFRGKKIDNGQWTYGLPTYDMEYVFGENDFDSPDSYMVDVNTIGQYTGLKDKNGTKIFEGDVVNHTVWSQLLVANYSLKANGFVLSSLSRNSEEYSMNDTLDIEIVGNIHDNKDLLK